MLDQVPKEERTALQVLLVMPDEVPCRSVGWGQIVYGDGVPRARRVEVPAPVKDANEAGLLQDVHLAVDCLPGRVKAKSPLLHKGGELLQCAHIETPADVGEALTEDELHLRVASGEEIQDVPGLRHICDRAGALEPIEEPFETACASDEFQQERFLARNLLHEPRLRVRLGHATTLCGPGRRRRTRSSVVLTHPL